jgi:hypothetical protein
MTGRGLSLSLDDFRSALEAEAGRSMADMFRLWLNHPGIPDDFRMRYAQPSASHFVVPALAGAAVTIKGRGGASIPAVFRGSGLQP